nr:hypothetical protein GCM10025732_28620 [Glycomyces mayteni]
MGAGALLALAFLTGGAAALQALAAVTGLAYLVAAALTWSVRLRASEADAPEGDRPEGPRRGCARCSPRTSCTRSASTSPRSRSR